VSRVLQNYEQYGQIKKTLPPFELRRRKYSIHKNNCSQSIPVSQVYTIYLDQYSLCLVALHMVTCSFTKILDVLRIYAKRCNGSTIFFISSTHHCLTLSWCLCSGIQDQFVIRKKLYSFLYETSPWQYHTQPRLNQIVEAVMHAPFQGAHGCRYATRQSLEKTSQDVSWRSDPSAIVFLFFQLSWTSDSNDVLRDHTEEMFTLQYTHEISIRLGYEG
jgi:hypothetical protein